MYESFIRYQHGVIGQLDSLAREYDFETIDANQGIDENARELALRVEAILNASESGDAGVRGEP